MAAAKMDDKATFSTFALCAKRKERWRLMEEVAQAMVEGDQSYKTSYFLPRALIGLGQYDTAARLAASSLKLWPKEGEVYTTAALASSRLEDWETTIKQADQALLIQRQKGASDDISAQAHVFRAEALLHQGKIEESNRELDIAKKIKTYDFATKMRERNDVVKTSGIIAEADTADEIYLGLTHLYPKAPTALGPFATFRMYNVTDKPVQLRVEVTVPSLSEPIGKAVTVVKGKREVLKLTPPLRADFKPGQLKVSQAAQLSYKITGPDGAVLYEETRKVTIEPQEMLPTSIRVHETDFRPTHELAGAWITPSAKVVAGLLDAAKKRLAGGEFGGAQATSFPQVQAVWDELRSRGLVLQRDPSVDSEGARMQKARLPAETLGAQSGNALEGCLLFATLLEALGLDAILVNLPGNMIVGWVPTKTDRSTPEAMKSTVSSPLGNAYFLETTMVSAAPADAAVLRGEAELVEKIGNGSFTNGAASLTTLAKLRKAGILARPAD
jgi:hypothetical protein